VFEARLRLHLRSWLGRWPATDTIDVVGSVRRVQPGWDGRRFSLVGVGTQDTAVLSVPPSWAPIMRERVARVASRWTQLVPMLPELVNRPDQPVYAGIFRWCDRPADLPEAGVWVDADDPRVPEWLRPFGHQVLIAWDPDTGRYLAGVGLKHHDRYGKELAVGTEQAARGRGLARRLVAQAARRILDEGGVPTYQHDPANVASARVAEAAGFPDRGWRSAGMP
jgi:RimJ/RimL family protein N-acetyltransferase